MKKIITCLLICLVGCSNANKFVTLELIPGSQIRDVAAMFYISNDKLGSENAKAYVVHLINNGNADLTGCHLVINDIYMAELKDLQYALLLGTETLSTNTLKAGQKLKIIFSHDVSNFVKFKTTNNLELQPQVVPLKLGLICDDGKAEWLLQ